jgi:hypothetical protein
MSSVLPGYFELLRTPVPGGRTFTEEDNSPERISAFEGRCYSEGQRHHEETQRGGKEGQRHPEAERIG